MSVDELSVAAPAAIGGGMVAWSDWEGTTPVATGLALTHLITALVVPGAAVLVAGPHDEGLVGALIDCGAKATWLVRSTVDADRLQPQFPDCTVLCGSIAQLDAKASFDLIVAADSAGRLTSVESDTREPYDVLPLLAAALRPSGVLVQLHDNPLGVHHLVELAPQDQRGADWYQPCDFDTIRFTSLPQAIVRLAEEGLVTDVAYSVFPTPSAPTVLLPHPLGPETVHQLNGQLAAALSLAFTKAYRGMALLSDPRRLAHLALSTGAEAVLAPGWLTIARASVGPASVSQSPGIILADDGDGRLDLLQLVGGRPRLTELVAPKTLIMRAGLRLVPGQSAQLATGRVFEELLIYLCSRADLAGLRLELGRFVEWLEARSVDGMISGPHALAAPDNVLDDGQGFDIGLLRWEPVEPVPTGVAVVRALWAFAVRLVAGTLPHPWDLSSTAADLTVTLTSMVDRGIDAAVLGAARDLHLSYETAIYQLTDEEADKRRGELTGLRSGSATSVGVRGYRELSEELARARFRIEHLEALGVWTEQIIKSRDYALSKMDWELRLYQRTPFGKVVTLCRAALRALRRDARKVFKKMRSGGGRSPSELEMLRQANAALKSERVVVARSVKAWAERGEAVPESVAAMVLDAAPIDQDGTEEA